VDPPSIDFERLDVFTAAVDAVVVLDEIAEDLPEGRGYLQDQLQRATNSMPLNIAEGAGEFAQAEKARFYRMVRRCGDRSEARIDGSNEA